MSIRKKIFLLAGILLALFGVVVGVLAAMQKLDGEQINNIVSYELPLSRLVSEFDVGTDRYELNIMRVLRLDTVSPEELQAATSTKQALTDGLRKDVDDNPIAAAAGDPRSRLPRPRTASTWRASKARSSTLFATSTDFWLSGNKRWAGLPTASATRRKHASLGFEKYAQAFGPDLSEIRRGLASLTERATRTVLTRQQLNTYLSFALFIAACGIGLGISAVGSAQAVSGLRQLVASARAIASGANSAPVVILTRDEVGELARSFNSMVEELRSRERIKDTFGKFVDPRLINQLIGSGADQAERRTLTIFFSDIADFSGISEQLTASAVVNLLNSYFSEVATVIHEHHGFIDKYIGDAVMAFWISPFSAGDDARQRCLPRGAGPAGGDGRASRQAAGDHWDAAQSTEA